MAKARIRKWVVVKWLAVAALIFATIIPKTELGHGAILAHMRYEIGDPGEEWYDEYYFLAEANWFNWGHVNYRHRDHGCYNDEHQVLRKDSPPMHLASFPPRYCGDRSSPTGNALFAICTTGEWTSGHFSRKNAL